MIAFAYSETYKDYMWILYLSEVCHTRQQILTFVDLKNMFDQNAVQENKIFQNYWTISPGRLPWLHYWIYAQIPIRFVYCHKEKDWRLNEVPGPFPHSTSLCKSIARIAKAKAFCRWSVSVGSFPCLLLPQNFHIMASLRYLDKWFCSLPCPVIY